jgi:WD40 repeat protein
MLAVAQPPGASISQPSLGYVFDDNAKAIRQISGVPGAANLDARVAAGTSLDSAFVHSRARLAIANAKDGGVVLVQWSGAPQVTAISSALSHVTLAAFSRSGDWAAISDGTTLEIWSGLTGAPALNATFNPDGGVTAAAVNDNGITVGANGHGAVMLLGDNARVLASGGNWIALAFLPNGNDLLAADATAQSLTLIQDIQNTAASSVVLSVNEKPGALAVSSDGSQAALGLADNVTVVNLASGAANSIACGCQAARFDLLVGTLVARIVDAQTGSQLLLDADSAQPRIASLPDLNLGVAQ